MSKTADYALALTPQDDASDILCELSALADDLRSRVPLVAAQKQLHATDLVSQPSGAAAAYSAGLLIAAQAIDSIIIRHGNGAQSH